MITVYSKPACPTCDSAKMQLTSAGIEHQVKVLDVDYDVSDLIDLCLASGSAPPRSFPVLEKDGVVYTYQQLSALIKEEQQ